MENIMIKTYSIGEVAKQIGVSTHTLRFYDKEGLLPDVHKNSAGLRRFTQEDVNWLKIMECLKSTGLPLKEIKHYLQLSKLGDATLQERLQIFQKQKQRLEEQIKELKNNMERINFKIKYYKAALHDGEADVFSKNDELQQERERLFKI